MTESLVCRCSRGTLYDVLQVSPWCGQDVIQAAYRALARSRHPDVNREPDAEEQMRRLNAAYQILSDPVRRVRYDEELALEAGRPMPLRTAPPPTPRPAATPAPIVVDDDWDPAMTAGKRPGSWSGAQPRSTAQPRPEPVASSRPSSFQSMGMDGREAFGFPRPALYVAVVLVTAIAALILWLVIDAFSDQPLPSYRGVRVGEERDIGNTQRSPWVGNSQAPDPGLSRPSERWNR